MFNRLADLVLRRPRTVMLGAAVALVVSVVIGGGVLDRLVEGGFVPPGSDADLARQELENRFDTGATDAVLLIDTDGGSVNDPAVVAAAVAVTREIAAVEGTDDVVSYWTTGDTSLRSVGGDLGLVLMRFPGDDTDPARQTAIDAVAENYDGISRGPIDIEFGGRQAVYARMGELIESDLAVAEAIAIPVTFVVLVVIFGGVVAASLPVGVGLLAALGTFLVLRMVTAVTDVSIFALNLVDVRRTAEKRGADQQGVVAEGHIGHAKHFERS